MEDESQVASINITRTGLLSGTDSVTFSTSNSTAMGGASCAPGVDYISVAGQTVTFVPNDTVETVNVTICGDMLNEPVQTLNLVLTGANLGSPNPALLSINDTASQYKTVTPISIDSGIPSLVPEVIAPYPSNIVVAGAPIIIGSMRVTLYDYSHTVPDNVDVLLVGPGGGIRNMVLMADAGGINPQGPVTLSFTDAGAGVLPDSGPLTTGNREPTSWVPGVANFPAPAQPGPYNEPGSTPGGAGTQTLFGNFGMTNPNGTWSLYIRQQGGGAGVVQGGWGLEFLVPTAAQASISGRVLTADGRPIRNAEVVVTGNSLTEPLRINTGSFGYYTFDGLRVGETYVVTVNSQRFTFPVPSLVISLTDNIADANFVADGGQ